MPDGVARTLPLLSAAGTQEDRLHYLLALRDVRDGWTRDGRDTYFRLLSQAERSIGGAGMPTFVRRIRTDALAALPASERSRIAAMLDAERQRAGAASLTAPPRPFVRAWTVDDSAALLDGRGDAGRGKAMYAAALCAQCHRLGAEGVAIGPDLTSVASRFSRRDLLESILAPSKVVAEPYRNDVVVTTDGLVIVGRVVPGRDFRASILQIAANPLAPDEITEIHKRRIESHTKSHTSPMPEGLLDTLRQAEIRDLLAYLESGGR